MKLNSDIVLLPMPLCVYVCCVKFESLWVEVCLTFLGRELNFFNDVNFVRLDSPLTTSLQNTYITCFWGYKNGTFSYYGILKASTCTKSKSSK